MVEIQIPFNGWSIKRLSAGIKRATSRTKKYGETGDTFSVTLLHGSTARYQLKFVVKLPLWFIARYLHETEGCSTQKEFEEIWREIHPRKKWTDNELVWYHYFEVHDGGISE